MPNLFEDEPENDPVDEAELNELDTEQKALDRAKIPRAFLNKYLHEKGNEQKHILKKDGHFTQHFFKYFLNIAGNDFDRLNGINPVVLNDGNQALLDAILEGMEDLDTNVVDDVREDNIVKGYMDKNADLIKDNSELKEKLIESVHIISGQVEALKEFIEIFKTHVKEEVDLTENTINIIKELVK